MSFETLYIPITDSNIAEFKRMSPKPMDCVINALEIVKYIDSKEAEHLRQTYGNKGFDIRSIENMMSALYSRLPSNRKYTYLKTGEIVSDMIFTLKPYSYFDFIKFSKKMEKNFCTICAFDCVKNGQRFQHVFLIAKNSNGQYVYIDPQIPSSSGNVFMKDITMIDDFYDHFYGWCEQKGSFKQLNGIFYILNWHNIYPAIDDLELELEKLAL